MKKISQFHAELSLTEESLANDPVEQFRVWFDAALAQDPEFANAMVLATTAQNMPSQRVVLLKSFDQQGFVFYTNYTSQKAQEIDKNPRVAALFFWASLHRQVRLTGEIVKLSREQSASYFKTRPRESQIGAWASEQSQVIADRVSLDSAYEKQAKRFDNKSIPLPDFWGGYCLKPNTYEFWQGRTKRLHDRIRYRRLADKNWLIERLAP